MKNNIENIVENNKNKINFTEIEIITALLDLEKASDEIKNFLKTKLLIENIGNKIKLTEIGELILSLASVKYSVNNILEKREDFIDITLDSSIEKLIFCPYNIKLSRSIIIGLQQDANIFTVKDLMENDLSLFYKGNGINSIIAFEKTLLEFEKLGFIRKK